MIWLEYPEDGKLRSRKVVSRSNAKSTGKYPSWKMARMLQYESRHELKAFMLLDANPDVISFNEQPCIIHYELDGMPHRHYPDIRVITTSGTEFWEVKERSDANSPEVMRRTALLSAALPALGFTYRMILAESLAQEPMLGNIRQLLRFGHKPVPLIEKEQIRQALIQSGFLPWHALTENSNPESRYFASRLILEGVLHIDHDQPLNGNSTVRLASVERSSTWGSPRT